MGASDEMLGPVRAREVCAAGRDGCVFDLEGTLRADPGRVTGSIRMNRIQARARPGRRRADSASWRESQGAGAVADDGYHRGDLAKPARCQLSKHFKFRERLPSCQDCKARAQL